MPWVSGIHVGPAQNLAMKFGGLSGYVKENMQDYHEVVLSRLKFMLDILDFG